jgi:hypothetical protein
MRNRGLVSPFTRANDTGCVPPCELFTCAILGAILSAKSHSTLAKRISSAHFPAAELLLSFETVISHSAEWFPFAKWQFCSIFISIQHTHKILFVVWKFTPSCFNPFSFMVGFRLFSACEMKCGIINHFLPLSFFFCFDIVQMSRRSLNWNVKISL